LDEYKGSWFCVVFTTIFVGQIFVQFYNFLVSEKYMVDDQLNFSENLFNQMASSLSWIGDCFTFFMILDSMLQEEENYRDCFLSR